MMKKGQVQQVFMYMMVMVVVGLIMLAGYKAINTSMSQACDIKIVTFKEDLENAVNKHFSYGDVAKVGLGVPCEIEKVCFLNNSANVDSGNVIIDQYDEGEDVEKINVFLIGEKTTPFMKIDKLYPRNGTIECVSVLAGKFNLKLLGKGDYALVTQS